MATVVERAVMDRDTRRRVRQQVLSTLGRVAEMRHPDRPKQALDFVEREVLSQNLGVLAALLSIDERLEELVDLLRAERGR